MIKVHNLGNFELFQDLKFKLGIFHLPRKEEHDILIEYIENKKNTKGQIFADIVVSLLIGFGLYMDISQNRIIGIILILLGSLLFYGINQNQKLNKELKQHIYNGIYKILYVEGRNPKICYINDKSNNYYLDLYFENNELITGRFLWNCEELAIKNMIDKNISSIKIWIIDFGHDVKFMITDFSLQNSYNVGR